MTHAADPTPEAPETFRRPSSSETDLALRWASALVGEPSATATLRLPPAPDAAAPAPRVAAADGPEGAPGEYEIRRWIGDDATGSVYEARQLALGRTVALKLMASARQGEAAARTLFFAETSAAGLPEHSGLVTVLDEGVTDHGRPFYAMRLVKGETWRHSLRQRMLKDNLVLWRKLAEAVGFAHLHGMAHNDLKPDTVVVDAVGTPWLGGWGLAVRLEPSGRRRSPGAAAGGTPAYMPPEIAVGDGSAGAASDIYLLGAILHELLAGAPPHPGDGALAALVAAAENRIAAIPPASPNLLPGELAVWGAWSGLARAMMASDPTRRIASVGRALEMMEEIELRRMSAEEIDRGQVFEREAEVSGDYALFRQAAMAFEEALRLTPNQKAAVDGLRRLRMSHARAAGRRRDFDLALSLLEPVADGFPEAAGLADELRAARQQARRRRQRLRSALFWLASAAVLALVAAVAWGLWRLRG